MNRQRHKQEAIIVLAGGVSRGGKLGWRSSVFGEPADVGISGSYVRIAAAAELWQQAPDSVVVPSGGRGQADNLFPPGLFCSTIMRRELEALGVPAAAIVEENQSGNTYQQLRAIAELVARHRWSEIQIVSSRFHLPRIRAMVECLAGLEALKVIASYVSAEEVVLAAEPDKWREQIEAAYQSDEFAKIIASEKCGTADVRAGRYRVG